MVEPWESHPLFPMVEAGHSFKGYFASRLVIMSELRARKPPNKMSTSREKKPLLSQRYQKHPLPKTSRPTRTLHISISLIILLGFVLYAQRKGAFNNNKSFEVGGKALPEWYGICSKEGRKIYTAPEEGGVGGVECVVISRKEVVDTGSLGQHPYSFTISSLTSLCSRSDTASLG